MFRPSANEWAEPPSLARDVRLLFDAEGLIAATAGPGRVVLAHTHPAGPLAALKREFPASANRLLNVLYATPSPEDVRLAARLRRPRSRGTGSIAERGRRT